VETFWSTQLVHVAANRADASWNHHSFLDCKSAFLDITTHSIGIYTTILYTFSIIKTQFPFHGNGAMQSLCWAQGQYLEMVRPKTTFEAMARSEGMSSGSIALRHTQTPWLIWLGDFESTVSEQPLAKPSGWKGNLENAIIRPLADGRGDTTTSGTGRNIRNLSLVLLDLVWSR
jgi:hypothetical protein